MLFPGKKPPFFPRNSPGNYSFFPRKPWLIPRKLQNGKWLFQDSKNSKCHLLYGKHGYSPPYPPRPGEKGRFDGGSLTFDSDSRQIAANCGNSPRVCKISQALKRRRAMAALSAALKRSRPKIARSWKSLTRPAGSRGEKTFGKRGEPTPRFRVWGNESLYRRAPRFIRGRRFATFGEAKRPEKFFLGLRVFWARKHRRQKGRFTVPVESRGKAGVPARRGSWKRREWVD